MNTDDHAAFLKCVEFLQRALRSQMDRRGQALGMEWIENERVALTDAANTWVMRNGGRSVTVYDVEVAERSAMGHSDYASKLPLYVAEMAFGLRVGARP